jgi:hypothetical protein
MLPTDGASAPRRRTLLLVLGCAAVALLVVYMLWPAATPPPPPSNQRREQQKAGAQQGTGSFDVRLQALKAPPPEPTPADRNPFRFYVKPPPPPPPLKPYVPPPPVPPAPRVGEKGWVAPPPPPIPLKFIGTLDKPGGKFAILMASDGHGLPTWARAGDTVLGQYKLITIGVESVTMEYLDGRGRQVIPMRGQ